MRRMLQFISVGLVVAVLFTSFGLGGALAAGPSATPTPDNPQSVPNGPWLQDDQTVSLASIMTNEDLYAKLQHLAEISKGRMTLEVAGYSNAPVDDLMQPVGYPLYVCKFGDNSDAKVKVFITSQIHGNEVLGTQAAVDLMQKLIAGGKEVDDILSKVSIWIMPRINPDGAAYTVNGERYPIRYSLGAWDPVSFGLLAGTKAPWYYSSRYQGYDQNRDYSPDVNFRINDTNKAAVEAALNDRTKNNSNYGGFYVTPEARIVTKVFTEFHPDIYLDLHHRGFNTLSDTDDRSVSIQVAADVAEPYTDPFTGKHYEVSPEVLKLAKQVNAVGWLALQKGDSSIGAIQKYPKVNLPGTSLGAFALNNTAIMLIEVKGQTQSLGQKEAGQLTMVVRQAVWGVLSSVADGSIYSVDPAIYDAIPESANSISSPHDAADGL